MEQPWAVAGAVVLAAVERVDEEGRPWIRAAGEAVGRARALSSVAPALLERAKAEGTPAVVARVGEEWVVLGILSTAPPPADARVDGRKVELAGAEEVTLRCGRASITLTAAGKVLIKGEYVLTHAAGVNRVRGGSVEIN